MLKNIGQYAILLIVIVAVIAIVFVACSAMGIAIPAWVAKVGLVLIVALVCVGAIRILIGGGLPPIA